jgi:hypothetical protein
MHVDALTVFWDAVAITGTAFSFAVLPQYLAARAGARDPKRIPDADDRTMAVELVHGYIWSECSRLACHVISLALGIGSAFLPRMERDPQPRSVVIYGTAFVLGLVAINCLTVQNSVRAYIAWRRG